MQTQKEQLGNQLPTLPTPQILSRILTLCIHTSLAQMLQEFDLWCLVGIGVYESKFLSWHAPLRGYSTQRCCKNHLGHYVSTFQLLWTGLEGLATPIPLNLDLSSRYGQIPSFLFIPSLSFISYYSKLCDSISFTTFLNSKFIYCKVCTLL